MKYIHQRPNWPHLTCDVAALAPSLAIVRHKQGRLLGRMEALGFMSRQEASLTTITSDVIKTSAIEGEVLDQQEVRSSVARRLGLDIGGLLPAKRDVEAIVELMLDATQRYDAPLTAKRLFGWHAALFPTGRSGLHKITVGGWRTDKSGPMEVVSGPIGRERVHFEAPAADRLRDEMRAFLKWFEAKPNIDGILRAGIAHLWFVTIHPFADGNGRIARAIADMSLARADGSKERFYSMSSEIERDKKRYYQQLENQQKRDTEVTPWLAWFLECLERSIDAAERSLATVLRKAKTWERIHHKPVNERQRGVINRLLGDFEGSLTTSKYAKLANCSSDTALRDIQELLDRGILLRNQGAGRSTSYRLNEPEAIPTHIDIAQVT